MLFKRGGRSLEILLGKAVGVDDAQVMSIAVGTDARVDRSPVPVMMELRRSMFDGCAIARIAVRITLWTFAIPHQEMSARPTTPVREPGESTRPRVDSRFPSGMGRAVSGTRPASTITASAGEP